jgi:HAD superfamily hydrolase (TIGR01509 family)
MATTEPVELVIFDCDGVLVDSERLAVQVDVRLLASLGWELTEAEVVERFVGVSDATMKRKIEEHLGRSLPDDWDAHFAQAYRDAFADELVVVEGILDALDAIEARSLPTCVASSGSHEKMHFTLGLTGLYERFDGRIFSADEVARGKPAPDLFLHAAEQMGAAPETCVVVEDSRFGVEAAVAAGMRVLGYVGGLTPASHLEPTATAVFDDMTLLPGLLDGT